MIKISTDRYVCLLRKQVGFTLVELMIVVAIVGILSAVAYPSFMNQIKKSRRADAFAATSMVQQAQERWRSNNINYAGNTELTALATASPPGMGLSATSSEGYYSLALSGNSASDYVLTATAINGKTQASDSGCTVLTVTVTNGNAANSPQICWAK